MTKQIKLGEVATYVNGYAFKPQDRGNVGLPIIRIQDLTGNSYDLGYYDGEYPAKVEINDGDVLISWSASLGVYIWNKGKALLNQHIFKVVFDKREIEKNYFVYAVQYKLKEMQTKVHGATMKHIVKSDFDSTEIPYPSIENQKEVVKKLDAVNHMIQKRKIQLQSHDKLIKARFVEMFGDPTTNPTGHPVKALHEVAEYFNGLTYKPENVSATGTVVLRSSNIQNSELDFEDTVRVDCPIRDKLWVKENDILMCSRNGSARLVGKVALIKGLAEPMSFGAFMMIIRSPYYQYLMTFFQMDAFRQQIKTGATTTINQITGRMLDDVMLPIPDMEAVAVFSAFVEQTDKSKFV